MTEKTDFLALVESCQKEKKCGRRDAMSATIRKYPALYKTWLAAQQGEPADGIPDISNEVMAASLRDSGIVPDTSAPTFAGRRAALWRQLLGTVKHPLKTLAPVSRRS